MANEFVTRTGLIVSGSTYLPAATSASKGYILSFDTSTKEVYYMSTSSVTVTVPGSDTQVIYNNGGSFGASSNFVFSGSNVGIGTTSPGAKLDVAGTIALRNASYYSGAYDWSFAQNSSTGRLAISYYGSEKVSIKDDGSVGIGTTNPTTALFISGSTDASQRITVNGSGNNSSLHLNYGGSNVGFINSYQNSELNIGTSVSAFVNFYTNNSERMRITSGGNVGIGTTSPGVKLHVAGGEIRVDAGQAITLDASNSMYLVGASNQLRLYNGGNPVVNITTGGNVGINTTSPNAKLDVSGSVLISGSLTVSGSSTFTNIGPAVFTGSITQNASTASFGGLVGIGTTTPSQKLDVQGDISIGVSGATTVHTYYNSTTRNQIVYTNNSSFEFHEGASERIRIAAGGNVGIGITSPSDQLSVGKTTGTSIAITTNQAAGSNASPLPVKLRFLGYADNELASIYSEDRSASTSNANLIFTTFTNNTGSTEQMRIDGTNSRVGIGITNPSQKLQVNGSIALNTVTNGSSRYYTYPDANHSWYYDDDIVGSSADVITYYQNFLIRHQDTTNVFLIDGSGNVGIGTTSPTAKLEVNGNIKATSFTGSFSGSVSAPGSTTQIVYNSGGALAADSGLVYSGSRVGIGTSNPNSGSLQIYTAADTNQLVLNGGPYTNIYAGNFLGNLYLSNNYYYSGGHVSDDASKRSMEISMTTDQIYFNTMPAGSPGSRTRLMTISGSQGFIGINTSSPTSFLDIFNNNGSYDSLRLRFDASGGGNWGFRPFNYGISNGGFTLYDYVNSTTALTIAATTNNVGIGTTNPSEKLDVQKAGTVAVRVYNTSSTDDAYFNAKNSTGDAFFGINATGQYLYTSNNIPTLFYNSGSERMRITNAGNVGIGTSSPSSKLEVYTPTGDTKLTITTTGGNSYVPRLSLDKRGDSAWNLSSPSGGFNFAIDQDGSTRLWIASSTGNVGIGTTSPNTKLDVSGSISLAGTDGLRIGYVGDNSAYDNVKLYYSGYNGGAPRVYLTPRTTPGSGVVQTYFHLLNSNGADTGSNNTMGLLVDGNIGVGISHNPTYNLEVSGSGYISGSLTVVGTITAQKLNVQQITSSVVYSSGSNIFGNSLANTQTLTGSVNITGSVNLGTGTIIYGDTTTPSLTLDQTNGSYLKYSTNSEVALLGSLAHLKASNGVSLMTGTTTHLYVSSSGNVGIGNTTPNQKLELSVGNSVAGGIRINYTASATTEGMDITYLNSGDTTTSFDSRYNSNSAVMRFRMKTAGTAVNAMTILGSGNIGIDNTNPQYQLHVGDGSEAEHIMIQSDGGGATLRFYDSVNDSGGDRYQIIGHLDTTQKLQFSATSSGLIAMSINPDGRIGMGTTSPSEKLTVAGAALIDSYLYLDSNEIWAKNSSALHVKADDKVYIQPAASTTATFDTNGNVGIGTTSPGYKLDVNGNSKFVAGFSSYTADGLFNANSRPGIYVSTPGGVERGTYIGYRDFGGGQYWGRIGVSGSVAWSLGISNSAGNSFSIGLNNDTATDYLTISSGSGYVGIGTASPNRALTVNGVIGISSGTANVPELVLSADGTATYISSTYKGTSSYVPLWFETNGSPRMAINTDGNVGIGTTSPASKLQIGSVGSTGYSVGNGLALGDGTRAAALNVDSSGTTLYSSTNLIFSPGTTEAVRITSVGNVGIGTTSPAYPLHVDSSTQQFRISGNTNHLNILSWADGVNVWSSENLYFGRDAATANKIFFQNGSASTTTMYVNTATEVVAVGSATPFTVGGTAKMSILGSSVMLTMGASTSNLMYFRQSGTGEYQIQTNNGGNDGNIQLQPYGGNVGIGTTSPGQKLQIDSPLQTEYYGTDNASPADAMNIVGTGAFRGLGTGSALLFSVPANTDGSNMWAQARILGTGDNGSNGNAEGAMFLQTRALYNPGVGGSWNWRTNMVLRASGNVGIGTINPNAKLQVIGPSLTVNDENTYGLWVSETGDDTKAIILGYDQGIDAGIITAVDKATAWKNLILQPNLGGVGVGTTSPSYKLHVSGTIAIENQGTTTIESTTFSGSLTTNTNIASVPTASFKAAFFDYYVASGSVNMRAGTVMAVHNNSTSRYTDTSTADIGTTAAVDFSTSIVAGSLVLTANISSGTWEVKTAYRAL